MSLAGSLISNILGLVSASPLVKNQGVGGGGWPGALQGGGGHVL